VHGFRDDIQVWDSGTVKIDTSAMTHYKYNPRKNPHWFTDTHDNRDGLKIKTMMTNNRAIYG